MNTALSKLHNVCKPSLPCLAVGLLVGLFAIKYSVPFSLALISSMIAAYIIFHKPELGILAIVVLISSIVFADDLPLVKIGVGSLQITDLILMILLYKVIAGSLAENDGQFFRSPLEKPLFLFLFIAVMSAFYSISLQGVDFNDVLRILRVTIYYLLFFVITHLIKKKEQIRFLMTSLLWIGGIVVVAMLIQATLGDAFQLLPGKLQRAGGLDEDYDSLRLQSPGQTLVYLCFITSTYLYIFDKREGGLFRQLFLILLFGAGVLLTYNRTYLITIVFSMTLFLLLARPQDRKRLTSLVMRCGTITVIAVLLFGTVSGKFESTWYAISHRYLTLFAGSELIESSPLNDRRLENGWALEQIVAHPVTGIGLGKDYRPQLYGSEDQIAYYVHNVYLWLIMDLGVFGFCFFAWFYGGFLARAMKNYKTSDDHLLRSVATGSAFAGIGMLPMALTIPLFMEWHSIVVIAIFMGMSESIIIAETIEAAPHAVPKVDNPFG